MEYNYEQIEKYLKGELSMVELNNFEQELATNSTLKEEVALYKDVDASLNNHFRFEKEDKALKAMFNEYGKKYAVEYASDQNNTSIEQNIEHNDANKVPKRTTITRRLFPLAALAAAAALLLFLFNPFTNQVSPTQLAEQNFTPYTLETFMGGGQSDEILKKGKKYYNGKAYDLALENFNQYLGINANDSEVLLAKGCAEFKLHQTNNAIQTFQKIKGQASAKWYLALAYLKNNDVENAKAQLQSLTSNAQYGKNAKALLKEL